MTTKQPRVSGVLEVLKEGGHEMDVQFPPGECEVIDECGLSWKLKTLKSSEIDWERSRHNLARLDVPIIEDKIEDMVEALRNVATTQ